MTPLQSQDVAALKRGLTNDSLRAALPNTVGGRSVAGGFWRLFSEHYPEGGGIQRWNSVTGWRRAWMEFSPDAFFFGEDLFGNQLTLVPGQANVFLWNHECDELADLLLDPPTLLETVLESGVDWIDAYTPEMLAVARRRLLDVPGICHLHWTQPLILGGRAALENASVLEAASHLKAHAELWAQLRGLPPGTEVIIKPK